MPQAFKDVLKGKTNFLKNKLRWNLLQLQSGFLGQNAYRGDFFGRTGQST